MQAMNPAIIMIPKRNQPIWMKIRKQYNLHNIMKIAEIATTTEYATATIK